jgi:hypothetical protein
MQGFVTDAGLEFLDRLGMSAAPLLERRTKRSGRVLCRPCLDWSERRPHLAGAVGAAICAHSLEKGWTRRIAGSRALLVTPIGARIFREKFGATLA